MCESKSAKGSDSFSLSPHTLGPFARNDPNKHGVGVVKGQKGRSVMCCGLTVSSFLACSTTQRRKTW